MVLSGFFIVVYSWASIVFSSGDILCVNRPWETSTSLFPVRIFIKIVCNGVIYCWETAFDVAAFYIKDGIFFIPSISNFIDWHESRGHVDFFRVSHTVGRQQPELAVWLQLFGCLSRLSLLVIVWPVSRFQSDLWSGQPFYLRTLEIVYWPDHTHRVFSSRVYWSYSTLTIQIEETPLWRSLLLIVVLLLYSLRISQK